MSKIESKKNFHRANRKLRRDLKNEQRHMISWKKMVGWPIGDYSMADPPAEE